MLTRVWTNWYPCTLLVGKPNGTAAIENSSAIPQKANTELLYDPEILLLGMDPKELKAGI